MLPFYNIETTVATIECLRTTPNLRRICGFESINDIPSEATFSRAFKEFADMNLSAITHQALIKEYLGDEIIMHISRDSTAIKAREKAVSKPNKEETKAKKKRKLGRPKKGEEKPKEPTRLQRQQNMTLEEMLEDLPKDCDFGCKKNSNGKKETWKGYKLHVDWADRGIPISCLLTSASLHDSQTSLPLSEMTNRAITNFYDLMDAAYDAEIIRADSIKRNHVPIIDSNPRNNEKIEMEPAKKERYKNRSNAERGFSRLKDEFGARKIRVRGNKKIFTALMFATLVLTADQLIILADEIIERSERQETPNSKAA